MKKVGSRELKNRLGHYLDLVQNGEPILVTERGRPVAKLVPAEASSAARPSVEEKLRELAAQGHLRLGTEPFARFKPARARGKPASRMIVEERE